MDNTNFKLNILTKLEHLYNYGFTIEEEHYSIIKVINIYVKIMKLKFSNLGKLYISNMTKDIEKIINNLNKDSHYNNFEYVNTIINYCIKELYFKYKKNNKETKIPDYTIDEIRDMAKTIIII